jgi:phage shock protein PspC (stress-responsive transcriptional regulator)
MQRVVSINLNGNAYQLEENGYNALFAFLDATESQIRDSPDRAQTLADLERTLAEKCQACLAPHKTVVTSAEIDRIIFEVGPGQPAAGAASSSSASSSTAGEPSSSTSSSGAGAAGPRHRRLYQISEGSMISGVCMGLAEFLHLDVTLIRIMFVLFALVTSGWGMLAYGVLMFVVPKVRTRAEASAGSPATGSTPPHRWPWDDGWPWDKHGWPWDRYGWPWDHPTEAQQRAPEQGLGAGRSDWRDSRQAWRDSRQAWRDQKREWREQRRADRMAHHPWPVWGTMSTIVFVMLGFFWLSFWTHGGFFFGWPFFWGFPHWMGIIFFFMMMRLIFMPFRMARWHRYGYEPYGPYGPYAHPHHAWLAMWQGMMWFAFMIFAVWAAYHYIPEVHEFIRSIQTSWNDSGLHA